MKYEFDTHTHTIVSGHAYSTLLENAEYASKIGLKMIAVTDHGPAMPGGPHIFYFGNLRVVPDNLFGVEILRGVEANILDHDGKLDIPYGILKKLDLVIASLHDVCIKPGSVEENTKALINAMDNEYVDIIGHAGNPAFPIDIDLFVEKAKEKDVLIEINNSSLGTSRIGSYDNCYKIAKKAKEIGAKVVMGSDAHICFDIGNFKLAADLIEKAGIPEENIMNTDVGKLKRYLSDKTKKVVTDFCRHQDD
ncbi:MAG: phosphatase [Clostridiales bacterium]|nr:phosphatase [Clostridiales bacterium]HBM81891.1 phosphatase [Clostridiaceae bacterium]